MLFNAEIIKTVARLLKEYDVTNIVVDPVMVAKGGQSLLELDAVTALQEELLPRASVVTPNIPEAEQMTGLEGIDSLAKMEEAAKAIHRLGVRHVVLKGGHL